MCFTRLSSLHGQNLHLALNSALGPFPVPTYRGRKFIRRKKLSVKLFNSINSLSFHSSNSTSKPPQSQSRLSIHNTFQFIDSVRPYILSQHKPILAGWLCSLVSVLSLSQIVPKVGKLSSVIRDVDAVKLRDEGLLLTLLFSVRLITSYWQQAFLWDAALKAVYDIRVHVFESVLQRDMEFFEGGAGVSAGDVAYRITAEASDVAETVFALLNTIVPSALQLSAMATNMFAISPTLSMLSAVAIPCVALVTAYLGEKQKYISRQANLSVANLSAYLNEVLPEILSVKANNAEPCENARFQNFAHADLSRHLKKKKIRAFVPQILQAVFFGTLFVLFLGSVIVSRGSFNGGGMVTFLTSLLFLIEPIQGVGKAYNELKLGEPAIERLCELKKLQSKVIEKPDSIDLKSITGDVRFCNIFFSYGRNMPLVLNGLSLHVKAGETVAIVGPSGGGKTTLAKLLLRLYDPTCGHILIDKHDIQSLRLESLRGHVGLVSQDIALFSGTVAENIGYRDLIKKIDMEKVERVARNANADEFIRSLPEGYNTKMGPRGSILSGGQKQRIAIARALYQNPSILILDEATSALDNKSELLVRQALQRLMENHTVLVIAHRLETVLMANRVFLLDDGKLQEIPRSSLMGGQNELLLSTGLVI